MHADMTVGLDLSCLENLKIYNGYEKVKQERKPILDDQSSQDDNDSDAGPQRERKSKCGRPANPIPRHKRDSHIKAEYKRRDKIQKGFDSLISLVPELGESTSSSRESKSVMLQKTAEYCRRLKTESGDIQNEMWALRAELEALGTEIHNLQEQLPQHGVETVDKQIKRQMDDLYDEYVQDQTQRNWKFWLFGFFMRPLYQSYRVATSKPQSYIEFNNTINNWVQETLSLTSLRKAFLEALRKISTRTKIMSCPEQIQEEAMANVGAHCIIPKLEAMAAVSPNPRPPPSPKTLTPAPSPTPTPPRTPTSSRKSGRRESRKSTESRSRSNTPPGGENRPKRRPSYRSEKRGPNKVSVSDANEHISRKYSFTNSQGSPSDLTYVPKTLVDMLPSPPAPASSSPGASPVSLPGYIPSSPAGSSSQKLLELLKNSSSATLVSLTQQKPAVACTAPLQPPFIYIPYSIPDLKNVPTVVTEMQVVSDNRDVLAQATTQPSFLSTSSNFLMSSNRSLPSTTSLVEKTAQTQPFVFSTQAMDIDINTQTNLSSSNSFLPICQSGTIANGSILPLQSAVHTTFNQDAAISASVVPMETSLDNCDTDSLLQTLSMFSSATSPASNVSDKSCGQSVLSSTDGSVGDANCIAPADLHEEDSLMKMLTMDVMDVNSLMTFLDDTKTNPNVSQSGNL